MYLNETVLADKYAGNSSETASGLIMHLFTGEVNILCEKFVYLATHNNSFHFRVICKIH